MIPHPFHFHPSSSCQLSTVTLQWAPTVFMPTMDFSTLVTYVTWSSLDLSSFLLNPLVDADHPAPGDVGTTIHT